MSTILAYPSKPEDERSLKAFLKALEIDFEVGQYDPDFVAKIRASEKEKKAGKVIKVKGKEELDDFLMSL